MPSLTATLPSRESPKGAAVDGGEEGPTSKLSELLGQLLEPIVRLTGARAAAVRELISDETHGHEHFAYLASLGLPPRACGPNQSMDRHCGACGRAADTSAVVWARDLSGCRTEVRAELAAQGQERLLVVPLTHRGRLLGVYNLFFDAQQPEPSASAKAMLSAMGELLGMALNNALMEADGQQHQLTLERQRMAAEVHDSVAQSVSFMKMRLALLEDALTAGQSARALEYCQELRGVASDAHTSLRIVLTHFRQATEALPLAQMLSTRLEQWRRDADIQFTLDNHCASLNLAPPRVSEVVHIVQEAITNVIRHARASHARVTLRGLGDGPGGGLGGGQVEVLIEDNGAGLAREATRGYDREHGSHYGLPIMRERAHRLQGSLDLAPCEGGGTRVRLVFPEHPTEAPR